MFCGVRPSMGWISDMCPEDEPAPLIEGAMRIL